MENYKIPLTENEVSKLTTFIIMYEDKLKDNAGAYEDLAKETINFTKEQINLFKENANLLRNG